MSKTLAITIHLIFIAFLSANIIALYTGCFSIGGPNLPYKIGYLIGISLLVLALTGLWLPNTHLFHHYVFRFMAYSGVIILMSLVFYPILIDIISQIKSSK
jgi:hypothetical protein